MKYASALIPVFLFWAAPLLSQERIAITHGPYLQNLSEHETTIVWTTNKNAVSWVELAPDDGTHFYLTERPKTFASKNGIKLEGTTHAVRLRGLTPGTKYRYRVFSKEIVGRERHEIVYGKVAATTAYRPFTFVTHNRAKPSVTFTMLNDIHGRSDTLEQLLKWVEPRHNDLIFFNGDMVSSLVSEHDLFAGFMDAGVNLFASETPMYYARGNHETRGVFATRFQNYFSPLSPTLYFLVRQGPACFVVLDCGEDKPDSDIEYSGITDYDSYRDLQALWLKEALISDAFTQASFKIVICHMPPAESWHGEAEILHKFVPLLNEAGIDLMLCGHLHKHVQREANQQIKFPILINSNNAIVKATVTDRQLMLDVIGIDGKKQDSLTLHK